MELILHLAILISIYAILGISLNLIVGYTGLLSITHAAFFGIGAYTSAILITRFEINFFLTVLAGIVVTAVISYLIGFVLSRFDDDYYALASFGFNIIVFTIFLNWQSLTRGPLGIPGIDRPHLFGFEFDSSLSFLILSVVFLTAIFYFGKYIVNSSFGRVLRAIRDDEEAISVFGYRTSFFKLTIFVIGAAIASIAGSLFASYITFIDPSSFVLFESILILAMIIMGGLGDIRGPIIGAAVLILLPEALRFVGLPIDAAAQLRQIIFGLALVLMMLYRPQGFVGKYRL